MRGRSHSSREGSRILRVTATTKIVLLLCSLSFLLYLDRVNLSTAAGPIQSDLHLSNLQLGIAFSAFAYSYVVTQTFGGLIADRFGPRWTIFGCVSIWVVTTIATGFVGGLVSLFVLRLLLGCGEGATLPACARAIVNWIPVERRGLVQGITHSCSRLGNAVTPPLIAFLVTASSWRASFVYVGIGTAIWLVAWSLYFRDDPRRHPAITEEELQRLPNHGVLGEIQPARIPWSRLLRRVAPTAAVYFCYGWTAWLYFTWLPVFFLHSYHLNIKTSAIFSSGVFFAGVVGDAMGGVISDRILRRTDSLWQARSVFISIAFICSVACLLPVLFTHNISFVTSSLSGAFFFLELSVAPIWLVAMDIAPAYAGTASGLINAGSAIAGILSPMFFGWIGDRTGNWNTPFFGSVFLLLLGAGLAQTIHPEIRIVGELNAPLTGVKAIRK
jgi:sugar phosphate permease